MENRETRVTGNPAKLVLFPIVGTIGGLLVGAVCGRMTTTDPFREVALVVQWGFLGSVAGVVLAVITVVLTRTRFTSTRSLAVAIAVIAVVVWALTVLFRGLLSSGVL